MEPTKDQIIVELKERIKELGDVNKLLTEPPFPNTFYTSASDCLQHHDATGQQLTELERQLLIYASELENILGKIEEGLS